VMLSLCGQAAQDHRKTYEIQPHPLEISSRVESPLSTESMGTTIRTYGLKEIRHSRESLQGPRPRTFCNVTSSPLLSPILGEFTGVFSSRCGQSSRRTPSAHQHHPDEFFVGTIPLEQWRRRTRVFQKISTIRCSTTWPGRSPSNRRGIAVNGPIVSQRSDVNAVVRGHRSADRGLSRTSPMPIMQLPLRHLRSGESPPYAQQCAALIAGGSDLLWSRPSSTPSTPRPH